MLARRRWEIANYQKSICNRPMLTHHHSDIKEPLVLQQTQENLCVADMWKIMRQSILRKSLWTKFERICLFFVCFFFTQVVFTHRQNYKKSRGRNSIGSGPTMGLDLVPRNSSKCNFNSKYRYENGICNNKKQPFTKGVAYIPFRR